MEAGLPPSLVSQNGQCTVNANDAFTMLGLCRRNPTKTALQRARGQGCWGALYNKIQQDHLTRVERPAPTNQQAHESGEGHWQRGKEHVEPQMPWELAELLSMQLSTKSEEGRPTPGC